MARIMRTCTICTHEKRAEIEQAMMSGESSYRAIASQFAIGRMALQRHANDHIADTIKQSKEAKEEILALNVTSEMVWANEQARAIYDTSIDGEEPQLRTALSALAEIRKQSELWAEIQGDLNRGTTIELVQHPEWISLREIIFKALEPWPDARGAVARAIMASGESNVQITS